MRFFLILCVVVISSCGWLGIYIPASPVSLSMMTEWDLKRERAWVLCRGYHHPEYSSELIKAELKRRNALKSCKIKRVVENVPDTYYEDALE
jgi:hypothetical protein